MEMKIFFKDLKDEVQKKVLKHLRLEKNEEEKLCKKPLFLIPDFDINTLIKYA